MSKIDLNLPEVSSIPSLMELNLHKKIKLSKWRKKADLTIKRVYGPHRVRETNALIVIIEYIDGTITIMSFERYLKEEELQRFLENHESIIYKDRNSLKLNTNIKISLFRQSVMPNIKYIYRPSFYKWKGRYYIELIFKDGTKLRMAYSRFVWEESNQKLIPEGHEIDHIDGNPLNNNSSNLQLLTPYENKLKSLGLSEYVLCTCPFTKFKHLIAENLVKDCLLRNRFKKLCDPYLTRQEYNQFRKKSNFKREDWISHIKSFNVYVLDTYQIYKDYKKTLSKEQLSKLTDPEIRKLALQNVNIEKLEHSNFIPKRKFIDGVSLQKKSMFIEELGKYIYIPVPLCYTWGKIIYYDRKFTDPFYITAFNLITDKNSLKEYIKKINPLTEKDKQDLRNMFNYINKIINHNNK